MDQGIERGTNPPLVRLMRPEGMNLLGLLLAGLLEANLASEATWNLTRALRGDIRVRAGRMTTTLRLDGRDVQILEGAQFRPRAEVAGTMTALLEMVNGVRIVVPVLTRKIRVSGDLLFLTRALPLLQGPESDTLFWRVFGRKVAGRKE